MNRGGPPGGMPPPGGANPDPNPKPDPDPKPDPNPDPYPNPNPNSSPNPKQGLKAALEFESHARQPVVQELPIVNGSAQDWSVQAALKAEDFSGPPSLKVPAQPYTLPLPLTPNPNPNPNPDPNPNPNP